jgi:putative endonuclease
MDEKKFLKNQCKLNFKENLKSDKMTNKEKGYHYEGKAIKLLESEGYEVLEKNYTVKGGEIDIIAQKNDCIVFFEIKYRRTSNYGSGIEAVNREKMRRIYRTAKKYLYNKKCYDFSYRFDLIAYNGEVYEWLENILWGEEYE